VVCKHALPVFFIPAEPFCFPATDVAHREVRIFVFFYLSEQSDR